MEKFSPKACAALLVSMCATIGSATTPPPFIELAWVAAGYGTVIYGKAEYDGLYAGSAEADINGDGAQDLVLGSSRADPLGRLGAGEVFVIFGPIENGVTFDLETLNGDNGFSLLGAVAGDDVYPSFSPGACDVNGDGYDEVLMRSNEALDDAGQAYVIYGADSFPATFDLAELDGVFGFSLDGGEADDVVSQIECAGDTNGDGFDDLIVGAEEAGPLWRGEAYLILGRESFPARIWLNEPHAPDGVTFMGTTKAGKFGQAVSGAGDIDGDGLDDLMIGAPDTDYGGVETGVAYLIWGREEFDPNGTGRVDFYVDQDYDRAGSDVAAAGDVNGDGFDDLLVGVWEMDFDGGDRSGATFLVYGGQEFPESVLLSSPDPSRGVGIFGGPGSHLGNSLARHADVNGDGYADIITGAGSARAWGKNYSGAAYVVFGGPELPSQIVADELDGVNGFRIHGETPEDHAGTSVTAGDLNGDGRDDVVVGAFFASHPERRWSGAVYILYDQIAPPNPWVVPPPIEVEP